MTSFLLRLLIVTTFIIPVFYPVRALPAAPAVSKNKLTIVNQSGEDTAIKLLGPREWLIEIPAGQERTVLLPSGDYTYITRYGQDPDFRFSRGTPFQIEQSRIGFTEATLTLISAPSSTYVDPNLVELFNRPVASPTPPPEQKTDSTDKPATAPPPSAKDRPKSEFILHRVTKGDTLPAISEYYSGEADYWPEIAKYNPNLDPLRLKEGATIKVPVYLAIVQKAPPTGKAASPASKKPPKTPSKPEKLPVLAPPTPPPAKSSGGTFGPK
ncbi:MAG: LysM peptidoglycan-binding domain-containing protein [Deltaproteobacteria bacterium]|nr:LysM peptidoglycan-binding domain-containing protein [Deltaproteobacteria bacterium]